MGNKLEGEGSYEGTRRYDRKLRKHVQAGKTAQAAEKARRAVEAGDQTLKDAERTAKHGPAANKRTAKPAAERAQKPKRR